MAISLAPAKWLSEDGTTDPVAVGVAGTGVVGILAGDGTKGIPGLNLTNAEANTDKANAARIIRPILEYMFNYQESLDTADKPTTMVISRSVTTSGTTIYNTYTLRFKVDATELEVAAEA